MVEALYGWVKNGSTGSGVLSVDDAFGVEEALLDLELRSLRSISSSPGARPQLAVPGSVNSRPSGFATATVDLAMSASACYSLSSPGFGIYARAQQLHGALDF